MINILLINILAIGSAVLLHYLFLFRLTAHIPKMHIKHPFRIVYGVFACLIAHAAEIWIFAFLYYLVSKNNDLGELQGNFDGSLTDCAYFSFTTFTTLGFGDIEPVGHIRFLTGIESLTGLVLITWSASFLYYEMQRHWRPD